MADGDTLLPNQVMYGLFSHSFELDGATLALVQSGSTYELRINGFPFNHLIELWKNKEFFGNKMIVTSYTKKESTHSHANHHHISSDIGKKSDVKPLFDFKIKPVSGNIIINNKNNESEKKTLTVPKVGTKKLFNFEEVNNTNHNVNLLDNSKQPDETKRESFPSYNEVCGKSNEERYNFLKGRNSQIKRSSSLHKK